MIKAGNNLVATSETRVAMMKRSRQNPKRSEPVREILEIRRLGPCAGYLGFLGVFSLRADSGSVRLRDSACCSPSASDVEVTKHNARSLPPCCDACTGTRTQHRKHAAHGLVMFLQFLRAFIINVIKRNQAPSPQRPEAHTTPMTDHGFCPAHHPVREAAGVVCS